MALLGGAGQYTFTLLLTQQHICPLGELPRQVSLMVPRIEIVQFAWISRAVLLSDAWTAQVLMPRMILTWRLRVGVWQISIVHLRLLVPDLHISLLCNCCMVRTGPHPNRACRLRIAPRWIHLSIRIWLQDLRSTSCHLRVVSSNVASVAVTMLLWRRPTDTRRPRMQVRRIVEC